MAIGQSFDGYSEPEFCAGERWPLRDPSSDSCAAISDLDKYRIVTDHAEESVIQVEAVLTEHCASADVEWTLQFERFVQ